MHRRRTFWIWILAVMLLAGSVDARPDPPALDPHFAAAKILVATESPATIPDPSGNHGANVVAQFTPQETIFTGDADPDNPASSLTQSGQAADSSPPPPPAQSL